MGIEKIAERLKSVLDSSGAKKKKRIAAIENLMARLEKKHSRISKKLEKTDSKKEVKKLERKLKMCNAQCSKGKEALAKLRS